MPRSSRSSSSSSSSFRRSAPAPASRAAPPPAARAAPPPAARAAPPPAARAAPPPAPAPAQAPTQGGGLMSSLASGFAMGTGSAMGRMAVGSLFGGGSKQEAPAPAPVAPESAPAPVTTEPSYGSDTMSRSQNIPDAKCTFDMREFEACLKRNSGSVLECDHYYKALQSCQSTV